MFRCRRVRILRTIPPTQFSTTVRKMRTLRGCATPPQTNSAIGSGLGLATSSASSSVKVPSNSARPTMVPEML